MRQIYIFRHGVTDWNKQRRIQGFSDIPLNYEGRRQAEQLREKLRQIKFDRCISSNLQRAVQTAKIALPNYKIESFSELKEANLGQAEGKTLEQVEQMWKELFWDIRHYDQDKFWGFRYPGGESRQEVVERFSGKVFSFKECDSLAISAHGGILRLFILSELLRSNLEVPVLEIPNCALYCLNYQIEQRESVEYPCYKCVGITLC
jgi:broad specificity phosphatase PhoE